MIQETIRFFYQSPTFYFPQRRELKSFLQQLIQQEGRRVEQIRIIFCTDEQLLAINRQFLQHNYFTDIITFPFSGKGEPLEAELYISIDRIRSNAADWQTTVQRELHRVIFHGVLHLCGYNDKSSQQIKKMREREDYYLRLYLGK